MENTLIAFDFDNTLTKESLFVHLKNYQNQLLFERGDEYFIVEKIFGGRPRLKTLRYYLSLLKLEKGILCIISFGYKDEIEQALKVVDLHHYFDFILGQNEIDHICQTRNKDKKNSRIPDKIYCLLTSQGESAQKKWNNIYFVDDSMSNFPKPNILLMDGLSNIEHHECKDANYFNVYHVYIPSTQLKEKKKEPSLKEQEAEVAANVRKLSFHSDSDDEKEQMQVRTDDRKISGFENIINKKEMVRIMTYQCQSSGMTGNDFEFLWYTIDAISSD